MFTYSMPTAKKVMSRALSLTALLIISQLVISAQQPGTTAASQPAQASVTPASDGARTAEKDAESRYRIGPGDLIDVRVFGKPQFSRDSVRVDSRGMIRMPLIEEEIKAACRTEAELAAEISRLLLEYVRHPQVDVFVKEYQSQPVAVLGSVHLPSRFQLQRRVRLLELLSFTGGPSDNAGRTIQIVHAAQSSVCDAGSQSASADDLAVVDYYKLTDTLRGDEKANPFVRAGDIISVIAADQVYVVGNVMRPSALPLRDPITISRAIAMVGGALPDTKKDRVRIVRQAPGSTAKTEIFVDLTAIDKKQATDIELIANDIIDVPISGSKRLLKSFIGAVVPSVASLPVHVIP
jgi:polysaccharide export outer membrane protein